MSKRESFKLVEIVKQFGGELVGDGGIRINQVATLESAGSGDIAFLAHPRYLDQLGQTRAGAVILAPEVRQATDIARIVCANPYAYFARVSALFNPPLTMRPGRHKSAVVDRTAKVAKSAHIAAGVVIGKGARIGSRAIIGPGCFVGDSAIIGAETRLHANVTFQHECQIGVRGIMHSGVVVGSDGFGIARDDTVWRKIPQIGRVVIGDDVEIGANSTIDRGALDDTVIGDGVKLDNLIQIAHNVHIGAGTAIAACTAVAGSTRIGAHCTIGGAAMISGHLTIADNVTISAGTFIMKSLMKPGRYTGVYPFSSHPAWLKNAAHIRQLDDMVTRVRRLEEPPQKPPKDKS